ncbi:HAD family hydrolase [Amycolatopsis sp. NPDC059657]|uniref:HAD family hydrolase n=1 Tax=Amycolatopsis sp. NPDC059657 TaxID=3346899 RepID=UPI0036719DC2
MALEAVFFDFDGLICDSERAARRSWEELYAESGVDFTDEVWGRMMGNSAGEEVAVGDLALRRGSGLSPAELARRRARKDALVAEEPLRPGVEECLDAVAGAGALAAVVSSSGLPWVGGHLQRLGIRDRFAFLITGELTERHKPAPDLYLLALRRACVEPESALAIEDSVAGVRAARAAGLRCVAVPGAAGGHQDLGEADLVLGTLDGFAVTEQKGAVR